MEVNEGTPALCHSMKGSLVLEKSLANVGWSEVHFKHLRLS